MKTLIAILTSALAGFSAFAQTPKITLQPESGLVPPGFKWTFSPMVTGNGLFYQWYRNGEAISGATGRILTITNTNSWFIDGILGDYSFVVTNTSGSVTSQVTSLKDRVIWRIEDGGNGHGYTPCYKQNATWSSAYEIAINIGGYLATSTSRTENEFMFSICRAQQYWRLIGYGYIGPFLGGFATNRTSPTIGWKWVTGEPFIYERWNVFNPAVINPLIVGSDWTYGWSEPNSATDEVLQFTGQTWDGPRPFWNDFEEKSAEYNTSSFIIEFNGSLEIYEHPLSQMGQMGGRFSFRTLASSLHPLHYQWQRDGIDLLGATNCVLSLTNVTLADAAEYRAVVTDGITTQISKTARLLFPPTVVSQNLTNRLVTEGSSASFSVEIGGRGPFSFQWFRNFAPIPEATNANLHLTGVALEQTGNYQVEISGPDGFTNSSPALVTVLPPTHTVVYQQDFEGTSIGSQWSLLKRSYTPHGQRRFLGDFGNSTARLTLTDLPLHTHVSMQFDLYLIRNIAPNAPSFTVGETSSGFSQTTRFSTLGGLNYQDFPGPNGLNLASGNAGAVERHTLGYEFERFIGRDAVQRININLPHTGNSVVFEFSGAGWPVLTSASWGLDNVIVSTAQLLGVSPPILVSLPQSQVVLERWQNAVFRASAIGPSPLAYQWLHDGSPIPGATNDYLILPPAQVDQVGSYGIRVENPNGSLTRNCAHLVVVRRLPESMTGTVGRPAFLEAEATGPANFQWFQDGRSVEGANSARMTWDKPTVADSGEWVARVFTDGAFLDRYAGWNNALDANPPLVSFNESGQPGELLWTYQHPAVPLDQPLEIGQFRSAATVLSNSIWCTPFTQGVLSLDKAGSVQWNLPLARGEIQGPVSADLALGVGFVAEYHASRGETDIHCLDLNTQVERWACTISGAATSAPSIAADGGIYVGTIRVGEGLGKYSRLYALDSKGAVRWWAETQNIGNQPAIGADGTIYTTESRAEGVEAQVVRLRAFSPAGQEKWSVVTGGNIFSSPTVAADGTIYINSPIGRLLAYTPDGQLKWTYQPTFAGWASAPVVGSDGSIYLGYGTGSGGVVCISSTGQVKWQTLLGSDVWGSLAVAADGTVYGWTQRGFLFALDANGKQQWTAPAPSLYSLWPMPVPVIGDDGIVYLTGHRHSSGGYFQAFRGTSGPDHSAWSMEHHDAQHTGRAKLRQLIPESVVSPGDSVEMRVETQEPDARFQWLKNGLEISGATNATLKLKPVVASDAGQYQVRMTYGGGIVQGPVNFLVVDQKFTKIPLGSGSPIVAWGDVDEDGEAELITGEGGLSIFKYQPDIGFARLTNALPAAANWGFSLGDANNDGHLDVFACETAKTMKLMLGDGKGSFTISSSITLSNEVANLNLSAWADVDRDGRLDIAVGAVGTTNTETAKPLVLLRGDGKGGFSATDYLQFGSGTYGVSWGDANNDGWPDLFPARHHEAPGFGYRSSLLLNSAGRLNQGQLFPAGNAGEGAWGDYDNDGDLDLFITFANGGLNLLYKNNGKGSFQQIQMVPFANDRGNSIGAAWGDYDNDGYLDLFVANRAGKNCFLYHNQGDGTFSRVMDAGMVNEVGNWLGCAWTDFDNDGFLDLAVANGGGQGVVYHNRGNQNQWLKVRAIGRQSNRSGIGAKVRAFAWFGGQDHQLLREINAGQGFGQGAAEAHFGLADATNINVLRIEWPSGQVQELSNVAPRQILKVAESDLVLPPALEVQWGGTIVLEPTGTIPDKAVFEWYYNGQIISGAAGRQLKLRGVSPATAGSYQVRVAGAREAVKTSAAILSVIGPEPLAERKLPASYWPGVPLLVSIKLAPGAGAVAQALEDQPPAGWRAVSVSDAGQWDVSKGRVKFGPFFDDAPRELHYVAIPGPDLAATSEFNGTAAADDITTPIVGDADIALGPVHPADRNPMDARLAIGETTSYSAAWRRGQLWPVAPESIPISYVTRAGYLWRNGEEYWFDLGETNAPTWWKTGPVPAAPTSALLPMGQISLGTGERSLPTNYLFPGILAVTIKIVPAAQSSSHAVEEKIPAGWKTEAISDGGSVDDSGRWIRWGPFFDTAVKNLRYNLVPGSNALAGAALEGIFSIDGIDTAIGGAGRIPVVSTLPPKLALKLPSANGQLILEIGASPGEEVILETSTDLNVWVESSRLRDFVAGVPTQVTLEANPDTHARFWRVRKP